MPRNGFETGFTLFEILLVITIVTLLGSLAIPVLSLSMEQTRKTEARVLIAQLKTGLEQYRTEYGRWPASMDDFLNEDGDAKIGFGVGEDQWGVLLRALSGFVNSEDNPRRIPFFQTDVQNLSSSLAEPYVRGEADLTTVRNLLDPWGRPYRLVLDTSGDHAVFANGETIHASLAVWSLGANPQDSEKFITSWQSGNL